MTHRLQSYLGYSYPAQLAEFVKREWPEQARKAQPSDVHLRQLLDAAYHASLLREEQRPVTFRLLFGGPDELPVDAGPPTGLLPIKLDRPRPFNEQEVRRISVAADFFRSLIAVSADPDNELRIWGILVSGTRWVNQVDGGRFIDGILPLRLVVQAPAPGRLTVCLGQQRIAALTGGRMQGLAFDLFQSQWLVDAFANVRKNALRSFFDKTSGYPPVPPNSDFMRVMSQNVLRRALSVVRNSKHGGTLVFIEPEEEAELKRENGPLRFKYRIADTGARTRYQALLRQAVIRLQELVHQEKLREISWAEYQRVPDEELNRLDEAFFEFAHFLADLMAVDGALVVTKRMELVGFGAELRAEAPGLASVRRALDVEATLWAKEALDDVGTRHRAVYRLCEEHSNCVAIVISQDAAVRFVKNHNGAVTYWNQLSW
ncbi:MAG: DNA integrity scanning protein DisA nucleotide-binding domain protein [Verrucomicrobia bacterium]|nr:DNA integrity scanning protein DisA nucleotide-binding domain protein [Verrucomicrobiota bacterium]